MDIRLLSRQGRHMLVHCASRALLHNYSLFMTVTGLVVCESLTSGLDVLLVLGVF